MATHMIPRILFVALLFCSTPALALWMPDPRDGERRAALTEKYERMADDIVRSNQEYRMRQEQERMQQEQERMATQMNLQRLEMEKQQRDMENRMAIMEAESAMDRK